MLIKIMNVNKEHKFIEVAFFFVMSYIPYVFAEGIGCSGILAILFVGIVMGHYAKYSMNPLSRITIKYTIETISRLAETFIFAYLGISFPLLGSEANPAIILIGLGALFLTRACSTFTLS